MTVIETPIPIPSVELIMQTVADFYHLTPAQIVSPDRHQHVCLARHVAMYLVRKRTKLSLEEIAWRLGRNDHTTVMHGVRRIEELWLRGPALMRNQIEWLDEKIGKPDPAKVA